MCRFLKTLVYVYPRGYVKWIVWESMKSLPNSCMPTVALCNLHAPETTTTLADLFLYVWLVRAILSLQLNLALLDHFTIMQKCLRLLHTIKKKQKNRSIRGLNSTRNNGFGSGLVEPAGDGTILRLGFLSMRSGRRTFERLRPYIKVKSTVMSSPVGVLKNTYFDS